MYGTMKTNRFIIAALFIAAAVSCQKDGFVDSENARETESAILVTGEQTKTSLNGKEIHWTNDDVIAVFDKTNDKNTFKITDVDGSYAAFSGVVTAGTTQIYAVYPENLALSANGSSLKVNIPADQTSKVGSFAEEHNISVAKGVKTLGVEAIPDVTFKNVCALLKFTIPPYIKDAKSVSFSTNSPISGEATVDFSGDEPALSVSPDGSKSVTMTGSYFAGDEFIFVLAPGTIQGFTVTVTTDKAEWTITRDSEITFKAGWYKNLGVLELEQVSATKASAIHTYDERNVLTGTEVTVNLNIPEATQEYVTSLSLQVKNSAGEVVRSISKDSAAATETLGADEKWPYLPQGNYTVEGSYTLADCAEPKSIAVTSFTSPAPVFKGTPTVAGTTSYSIYCNDGGDKKNPTGANLHPAETISDISASCPAVANISSKILAKIPVNYSITLDGSEQLKNGTTTSTAAIEVGDKAGITWGQHTLVATFTFDGVAISGSSVCHITGLPYRANPLTSECGWKQTTGSTGPVSWQSDHAHMEGSSSKQIIKSPQFRIPADVSVAVSASASIHSVAAGWIWYHGDFKCRVSGNQVFRKQGEEGKTSWGVGENTVNCSPTGTGILSTGNSYVELENSGTTVNLYVKVYNVSILYN